MGAIYYIECLDCECGVQIGKHFGAVQDILTDDELDQLYDGKSLGAVSGKHQAEDETAQIIDAIEGTDWFEYRKMPKRLLTKIAKGYAQLLQTSEQQTESNWGFWNEADTLHDFFKDVIGFIHDHKDHKVGWQSNGHLFGSRGLPTYHHKPKRPQARERK